MQVPTEPEPVIDMLAAAREKLGIKTAGIHGDQTLDTRAKFLIFGGSGVGKTVLSATTAQVADWCPVLLLDPEGGATSLMTRDYGTNLEVAPIDAPAKVESIFRGVKSGRLPYRTVILDSIGEMYLMRIKEVMVTQGTHLDSDQAEQLHYAIAHGWLRRIVRDFLFHAPQLKCVVVTCGEQVYADETSGVGLISPALSGKLSGEVGRIFDLVLWMHVKTDPNDNKPLIRVAQVQPDRRVRAKDRWDLFPALIERPNFAEMWALRVAQVAKLQAQRDSKPQGG